MTQDRNPPPRSRPGRRRRVHGAVIWDLARRAYLQGGDPRLICEQYGLNRSTFRDRARREGWRREDILDDARPWTRMDENTMELRRSDLIVTAWTHAARAVARGKRLEARSWLAVIRDLGASPALLDRCMEADDPALPADPAPGPGVHGGSAVSPSPNESAAWPALTADSAVSAPKTCMAGPEGALPASEPAAERPSAPVPDAAEPEPASPGAPAAPPETGLQPEAPPLPWAALQARPEAHCTWEERALRGGRFLQRLDRLAERDRPEAERAWAKWSAKYGVDPDRPPGPPPGGAAEQWIGEFRVVRP